MCEQAHVEDDQGPRTVQTAERCPAAEEPDCVSSAGTWHDANMYEQPHVEHNWRTASKHTGALEQHRESAQLEHDSSLGHL
eukprot:386723-Pelagomonas_calceolata.AAC.6